MKKVIIIMIMIMIVSAVSAETKNYVVENALWKTFSSEGEVEIQKVTHKDGNWNVFACCFYPVENVNRIGMVLARAEMSLYKEIMKRFFPGESTINFSGRKISRRINASGNLELMVYIDLMRIAYTNKKLWGKYN